MGEKKVKAQLKLVADMLLPCYLDVFMCVLTKFICVILFSGVGFRTNQKSPFSTRHRASRFTQNFQCLHGTNLVQTGS